MSDKADHLPGTHQYITEHKAFIKNIGALDKVEKESSYDQKDLNNAIGKFKGFHLI